MTSQLPTAYNGESAKPKKFCNQKIRNARKILKNFRIEFVFSDFIGKIAVKVLLYRYSAYFKETCKFRIQTRCRSLSYYFYYSSITFLEPRNKKW